jgi:DNA-binding response OmpR family regulator
VLAVDDEEWARRLLVRILTAEKFEVVPAARGSDALCKLEDREFDLVILDRAMPDMTGDEVAVRIRAKKPGMPIVLVTGLGDLMKQSGEKLAGVDVILSKPFSLDELKSAMGQALQIRAADRGRVLAEAGKGPPRP